METDRRSFLRAAGSSLVVGAGSVWRASAAAQAPASPVSFPGIPNPLEGGVDVIATGYIWTEGPVWVGGEAGHLLFSDVPGNAIYSWDAKRTTVFLAPSGYQGFPIPDSLREAGSNGLALGRGGLLIADSGTRALARVDLATRQKAVFAESYQGKRFNSPNDLVVARNGTVYFTDPPYGLAGVQKSPLRELTYTGVFRVTPDNQVHLMADNLFPNGIALSPDNRVLYATDNSGWVAIDLDGSGMPTGQRQFVASESVGGARGDGMKADSAGNIWTSGRGGIYVFSPKGEHIGFAPIAGRVSNCAFGPGRYLYVTNDTQVVRGRIRTDFPGGSPIQVLTRRRSPDRELSAFASSARRRISHRPIPIRFRWWAGPSVRFRNPSPRDRTTARPGGSPAKSANHLLSLSGHLGTPSAARSWSRFEYPSEATGGSSAWIPNLSTSSSRLIAVAWLS